MAKSKYRLRQLVYQYSMKGVRVLNYYTLDGLVKMFSKVEEACASLKTVMNCNGKQIIQGTSFTVKNKIHLKELKHHLEIKILEKTILANKT